MPFMAAKRGFDIFEHYDRIKESREARDAGAAKGSLTLPPSSMSGIVLAGLGHPQEMGSF